MTIGIGAVGYVAGWGFTNEWTLRLVGMEIDGQSRSFEVMAISRPDGLGGVANLGLTLAESKLLLKLRQQQLVAEQGEVASCVKVGTSPA